MTPDFLGVEKRQAREHRLEAPPGGRRARPEEVGRVDRPHGRSRRLPPRSRPPARDRGHPLHRRSDERRGEGADEGHRPVLRQRGVLRAPPEAVDHDRHLTRPRPSPRRTPTRGPPGRVGPRCPFWGPTHRRAPRSGSDSTCSGRAGLGFLAGRRRGRGSPHARVTRAGRELISARGSRQVGLGNLHRSSCGASPRAARWFRPEDGRCVARRDRIRTSARRQRRCRSGSSGSPRRRPANTRTRRGTRRRSPRRRRRRRRHRT